MDTGLQQEFKMILRNPAFYQHPTKEQLKIVNTFLQKGLSEERINQLMEDIKLEEQQGRFSFSNLPPSNLSLPNLPSPSINSNVDIFRQLADYIKFNASLDPQVLNDYKTKLGWPIDSFNSALAKMTPKIHGLFPQLFIFKDGNMIVLFLSFEIKNEIVDIIYQHQRDIYDGKINRQNNSLSSWLWSVGVRDQQAKEIVARIDDMIIKLILVGGAKNQLNLQPLSHQISSEISKINLQPIGSPGNVDRRTFDLMMSIFAQDNSNMLKPDVIEYLNNVRKSFGLTILQFNAIIKNGWVLAGRGNDIVPFIEKDQRGEVKFVKEFLEQFGSVKPVKMTAKPINNKTINNTINKKETNKKGPRLIGNNKNKSTDESKNDPSKPNNLIDLHYALSLLDDFINIDLREINAKEMMKFGRNGILIPDIHKLGAEVADYAEMLDDIMLTGHDFALENDVFYDMFDLWKIRLIDITDNQVKLGKRCINKETPILGTPVDELTEGEYIMLSNKICWENEELMEYIRTRGGKNDATNLKTYPSRRIWENDADFSLILAIPQARKNGFSKWLKEITSTGLAKRISDLTLDRMYVCSSVLTSKGRAFREIARRELSQDPKLMSIWQKIREDADNIPRIKNRELRDELSRAVTLALKSTSIAEFRSYFKGLNEDERDALKTFDPHLESLIESCYDGQECVFGVSNTLIALRNQIARLKKVSIVDLDND